MIEYESLLFPLFESLRKQGFILGVSEYLLAIETIRSGIGLESEEKFQALCRLLWVKSQEEQEIFNIEFDKLVKPQLQILPMMEPLAENPPPSIPVKQPSPNSGFSLEDDKRQRKEDGTERERNKHEGKSTAAPTSECSSDNRQPPAETQVISQTSVSPRRLVPVKTKPLKPRLRYQLRLRLPISPREMAGIWRKLRRPQRVGPLEELDVEGTIESLCQTGFLLRPILQRRRRNQARLLVLVDQQGSMVPFAPLIEATIQSLVRGGLLGRISIYYFRDCSEGVLYKHPNLIMGSTTLATVLAEHAKDNSVAIISDGGAASGACDSKRVADTKAFLKNLREYTYLYTWINPMPCHRWKNTTAEDIATMIPMFPLDREGLNDAVNILRGHPFPPEVILDE